MRALRRATRTLAHLSAEAPLWEASMMTAELQPDNFIEPPNGTILVNPIARQAAREAIPKNVVWLTALEYSRKFNDILDPLGQSVLTEGYLRKKNDLYGKLFRNADTYLIANKDLDDVSAREAWQRWFEEVEEHMWWWRLQRWRVQCFTEANLEILPPGPLREETRYTHVVDMPFSMQEAVWRARQDWLPEAARLDNIPSPTLVARRSHEGRSQIVAAIKAAEDKLLAEARDAGDKDIVRAVANQYYLCADPTGPRSSRHPHITVDAIKKATDVDTLAQWMLLVQLDNFDDRVFAIAARACELRKDAKGAALAEWCRGLVQRDVDAATRKVDGVKFEPLPPTEEEKKLGALPAHVGEVRDKASYDAFRAYFADINPALTPVLPPDVQKWWGKATEYCLEEWDKLVAAGKFGRELRLAQYAATARAWAEAHPDLAKTQYPPPLPPVKKDEHGTRMIARLVGAYGGAGILDAAHKYDEDFVVDILTQLDWKLVPAAQVEELIAEYPSLGLPQGRLTAAHKERLALSGMPVQKLLA